MVNVNLDDIKTFRILDNANVAKALIKEGVEPSYQNSYLQMTKKCYKKSARYSAKENFHTVKVVPVVTEKRKPGRQSLDVQNNMTI